MRRLVCLLAWIAQDVSRLRSCRPLLACHVSRDWGAEQALSRYMQGPAKANFIHVVIGTG